MKHTLGIITLYLGAIVAANLTLHAQVFGPATVLINAFLFIGCDLVTRDALHDRWQRHRGRTILGLIAAGGMITYLLNQDSGRIAGASVVAFCAVQSVDTLVYSLLPQRRLVRAMQSNSAAALVDSIVFPLLAFGGAAPGFVLTMVLAKVAGSALWMGVAMGLERRHRSITPHG